MKMVAEYLEHALNFERMAADEPNPELKAYFERQAANYRKLAAERVKKVRVRAARRYGLAHREFLSAQRKPNGERNPGRNARDGRPRRAGLLLGLQVQPFGRDQRRSPAGSFAAV